MDSTDNRTVSLEQPSSAVSGKSKGLANLRPWKPGQSGNPAGGPKRKPLSDALAKHLTPAECDEIAKAMVAKMRKASVAHFHEVADRLEGKVADSDDSRGNVVFNIKISASRPGRPQLQDDTDDGQ